jgi:nucleotide-binding universal stress UspA family protein
VCCCSLLDSQPVTDTAEVAGTRSWPQSGKVDAKELRIMTSNEIVVGLDDSPSAKAALRWGAEQAIRRQAVLRAVHVFDWPYGPRDTTVDARNNANLTFDATQAAYVAGITQVFEDISPRPDWLIQFAKGERGPVLVRESHDSQLLVVGTREHVGLGRVLTGSVSHYCVSHARCPVVAVPTELLDQDGADRAGKENEIVVGLDLSASARGALSWAAEHAKETGQSLRAVHAVDLSPDVNLQLGMGRIAVPMDPSALDTAYCKAIAAEFDSIHPEPGWRLEFFSGQAGPVLLAESIGAALLVVGTKEHVGIGRLVFGSVSHYCLSHAQCSAVVAVPTVLDHGVDKDHDHAAAASNISPD